MIFTLPVTSRGQSNFDKYPPFSENSDSENKLQGFKNFLTGYLFAFVEHFCNRLCSHYRYLFTQPVVYNSKNQNVIFEIFCSCTTSDKSISEVVDLDFWRR